MSMLSLVRLQIDLAYKLRIIDSHDWHQKAWEFFPGNRELKRDFLTRVDLDDHEAKLWILSPVKPVRPGWCPDNCFQVKEIAETFLSHSTFRFDLKANPTRKLSLPGESGKPSKKKRISLTNREDLIAWLTRKGEAAGFKIDESAALEMSPVSKTVFTKKDHKGVHGVVQFRGVLKVTDKAKFAEAYHQGIGSAKAFGFGLMLLAPNP